MRFLKTHYLNDGKLFNDGRPVDLIQIEKEEDYQTLLTNILLSGYYNHSYFDRHIDYREETVKFDAFFLSSILRFLRPKSMLEMGCGRGDMLFLLGLDRRVHVQGIEFSPDVLETIWPPLAGKVICGDILEVCQQPLLQTRRFDIFCAFDLWEHIPPGKLSEYIASFVALAEKDALFFFTIPAFGEDRVFGEVFPLEFEENRERFSKRLPFDHLIVETTDPPIPVKGHLICAHTDWWQKQFETHGLIRQEGLERNIHTFFDEHLFYARKSFYVFSLNTPEAHQRINRLKERRLTLFRKWKLFVAVQEDIERVLQKEEKSFIDLKELKLTVNHAEFYMLLDLRKRLKKWVGQPPEGGKPRLVGRIWRSLTDRIIERFLDIYLRTYKKRHYLIP